jgi:hypothetical protein
MPTRQTFRRLAIGATIAIALAACSGSPGGAGQQAAATVVPVSSAPAAVPFPSVVMPEQLRGTWIANVQRPGPSSGIWRLRISEHLMELKNPGVASDADYFWLWTDRIDGSSFHMASDADCSTADYTWAISGGQLLMTTSNDACGDRKVILTTPFKLDS